MSDLPVHEEGIRLKLFEGVASIHDVILTECRSADNHIAISRRFSFPPELGYQPTFMDTFTNTSDQPFDGVCGFSVKFPAGTEHLMDSTKQRVEIAADGRVQIADKAIWIAPSGWGKPGQPLPALRFRNLSSPLQAELYWNAQDCSLEVRHKLNLMPGERRYLVNQLLVFSRSKEALPDVADTPPMSDFSEIILPAVRDLGLNFGRVRLSHSEFSVDVVDEWLYEPRTKDQAGFIWTGTPEMGVEGELGHAQLGLLFVDGQPVGFSTNGILPASQDGESTWKLTDPHYRAIRSFAEGREKHPSLELRTMEGMSQDQLLSITRHPMLHEGVGFALWSDSFQNCTNQARTVHITYSNTFGAAPVNWTDAKGQPLPRSGPALSGAALGGACLVEHAGQQRPCTWFKFNAPGAPCVPQIRWKAPTLIAFEFTLEIPATSVRRLSLSAKQVLLDSMSGDLPTIIGGFYESLPGHQPTGDPERDATSLPCNNIRMTAK